MTLLLAGFPLLILFASLLPCVRWKMTTFLGLAIAAAFLSRWIYFQDSVPLLAATLVTGVVSAWTPITIAWGALFLFQCLELDGRLTTLIEYLKQQTRNPVHHVLILGYSFGFFIEGLCGFGSPMLVGSVLLVGLGHPPVRAGLFMLIVSITPISLGAVGVPTWFGFSQLELSRELMLQVGAKTALIHAIAGLIVPWFALRLLFTTEIILKNWGIVLLALVTAVIPYAWAAQYSLEFPAIFGGISSLISVGVGSHWLERNKVPGRIAARTAFLAAAPLIVCVLALIVSRIPGTAVRGWLFEGSPWISFSLPEGTHVGVSTSLVFSLENIFGQLVRATHRFLYSPSLFPFFIVGALFLHEKDLAKRAFSNSWHRVRRPFIFISGILMMVGLMRVGEGRSSLMFLGETLADHMGSVWIYTAPWLGAVGAFITGSTTVSNLTFGGLQGSVAHHLNLDLPLVLALQSAGSAAGTATCLSLIVSVTSVLNLPGREKEFLRIAAPFAIFYTLILTLIAHFFR